MVRRDELDTKLLAEVIRCKAGRNTFFAIPYLRLLYEIGVGMPFLF
jgi:hypothetical protein